MTHGKEVMVGVDTLRLITSVVADRDSFQSGHCSVEWPPPQSVIVRLVGEKVLHEYITHMIQICQNNSVLNEGRLDFCFNRKILQVNRCTV